MKIGLGQCLIDPGLIRLNAHIPKVVMVSANENHTPIAFPVERNSGMDRARPVRAAFVGVLKRIACTPMKSQAQISPACCSRKMRHPGDGFCPCGRMYLATVRAETLCPSLASSAWILRWPHKAFAKVIRRMSNLSSPEIGCRPLFPDAGD